MGNISKVTVYKQVFVGQKTEQTTALEPKKICAFRNINMAIEAIQTFGEMTYDLGKEYNRCCHPNEYNTNAESYLPCVIRTQFGNTHDKWGYKFILLENGIFGTRPEDGIEIFRIYYVVERYDKK